MGAAVEPLEAPGKRAGRGAGKAKGKACLVRGDTHNCARKCLPTETVAALGTPWGYYQGASLQTPHNSCSRNMDKIKKQINLISVMQ